MEQDSSTRVMEVVRAIIELVHGKMNEPCDVDDIITATTLVELGLGHTLNRLGIAQSICDDENFAIRGIYSVTYNSWRNIGDIVATVMAEEPEESAAAG